MPKHAEFHAAGKHDAECATELSERNFKDSNIMEKHFREGNTARMKAMRIRAQSYMAQYLDK